MNGFERYMAMVTGHNVDVVPRIQILMHYAADYVDASYSDFASDYKVMTSAKLKLADDFGFDMVDIMSDPYRETTAFGAQIQYRSETTPKCIKSPLQDKKDTNRLAVPNINTSERLVNAIKAIEEFSSKARNIYSINGWVEGPAAEAADLRGVENFLIDLLDDPAYSSELMSICNETAIKFAEAQIKAGADTIGIGDAIASQISLKVYEEQILPKEKELVDGIHRAGGLVRLHICGDINRFLPLLGHLGVDIIDCDHMVNMTDARKYMGNRCALAGNIDPVSGLLNGSPTKIRQYYQDLYSQVGNPFFINAGCEIPRGTPNENLKALCEPIYVKK